MKSTKIYILLIAIAFLSFSCSEDDEKKDEIDEPINAVDYLFLQNSIYYFKVETIDGNNWGYETSELIDISISTDNLRIFNDKLSLLTIDNLDEEIIYYPFNSILELEFTFSYKDKLLESKWINFIDFSKDEWTILEYKNERNQKIDIDYNLSMKGRKVKSIIFNYEGIDYNGFEIEIISNSIVKEYNGNSVSLEYSDYQNQTMWFVEELGMVKKTFLRENVNLENDYMKYVKMDYVLDKIINLN